MKNSLPDEYQWVAYLVMFAVITAILVMGRSTLASMTRNWRKVFRKITPAETAAHELGDAEMALLEAQTAKEYAASIIGYNEARIKRLRAFLASFSNANLS